MDSEFAVLDKLESLEAKATLEPWVSDGAVVSMGADSEVTLAECYGVDGGLVASAADAALIAAARNALPALLLIARAAVVIRNAHCAHFDTRGGVDCDNCQSCYEKQVARIATTQALGSLK